MSDNQPQDGALPRENLVRAVMPGGVEFRDADSHEDGRIGTLHGNFAVFNEWTEINSAFEGHFMERNDPGAFKKTIKENRSGVRVLFDHGHDPQIGNKPLGPLEELSADAGYVVPLLDTSYNRDLLPGLKAGVYGASYRFQVMKEELKQDPGVSDHNPKGLPERTIKEVRLFELGPVTFPAYAGATAGVRSLTDEFLAERSPITTEDVPENTDPEPPEGTSDTEPADATPDEDEVKDDEPRHSIESRPTPEPDTQTSERMEKEMKDAKDYRSVEEIDDRLAEIKEQQNEIYSEFGVRSFDSDTQATWDELKEETDILKKMRSDFLERKAYIDGQIKEGKKEEGAASPRVVANRNSAPDNVFDLPEYHNRSASHEHLGTLLREGAERALEGFTYPNPHVDAAEASQNAKEMLDREDPQNEMAQRLLVHGSPTYRRAFWKTQAKQPLTAEEQRKLQEGMQIEARALTAATDGGITVPAQIDPTILLSSSGALNPFRQVSKLVRTTSFQWQGVTSAGVTAAYALEGAAMIDNTPTLVAPTITPERANVFVPYTWEAAQDWASLEGEMAALFADSKDILEATQFAVGAGHASNVPQGVLVGAGTLVGGATITVGTTDLFRLADALPVRFQPRATWLATPTLFSKIRQVSGGANTGIWAENLQVGMPPRLLGYPAYKASSVGTAWADLGGGPKFAIIGDFNYFAIVDRIGFQVRQVDTLFNGNTAGGIAYPNGMGGLIGYWRNSSGVLASNAFRTGTVT